MGDKELEKRHYEQAIELYKKSREFGIDANKINELVKSVAIKKEEDKKRDKANTIYLQAQSVLKKGNISRGITLLAEVLAMFPNHEAAKSALADYKEEREALIKKVNNGALDAYNRQDFLTAKNKWEVAYGLDPEDLTVKAYLKDVKRKIQEKFLAAIKRGDSLGKSGQLVQARKEYKKALLYRPKNDNAKKRIVKIDLEITKKYQKQREQGINLYNQKQYVGALKVFKTILKDIDDDPVSLEYKEKINNLMRSLRLFNDLKVQYQNRNFEGANDKAKELAGINPNYPGLKVFQKKLKKELLNMSREEALSEMFQEGVVNYKKKQFDKAISKWTEILSRDPENELVADYIERAKVKKKEAEDKDFNDGLAAMETKDWLTARDKFQNALSANPKNVKARNELTEVNFEIEKWKEELEKSGMAKFSAGDYFLAKADFETLLKINIENFKIEEMVYKCKMVEEFKKNGDDAYKKRDLPAAVTAYKNVTDINPNDRDSFRKFESIMKDLQNQKDKLKKDAENYMNTGNYIRALGNWQILVQGGLVKGSEKGEVEANIQQAKKKLKDSINNKLRLAKSAEKTGSLSRAIGHYRDVVSLDPNNVNARRKIDNLNIALKKKRAADKKAKRRSTAALFEEGISFYKQERYKAAIGKWQQVLKLDPNNKKVKDYIQRARTKLNLMGE